MRHGWLSAALRASAAGTPADTREVLPAAVLQQLRHRAQRRATQPARGVLQHQQEAPLVPQRAPANGDELDIGAWMAALDDQPPSQPPADGAACRSGTAAADSRLPAAMTARKQTVPAPADKLRDDPAHAPCTTGVFAQREKRKAEADSKRRAKKAMLPDGAGDLSFFMQLRKPGIGGQTAPPSEPAPMESGTADSTDSSAGAAGADCSGARNQPQVRKCRRQTPHRSRASCWLWPRLLISGAA